MPTINFVDGLALTDTIVERSNQRYIVNFADAIGIFDTPGSWRGEQYPRHFGEHLLLSDELDHNANNRFYQEFHDRLIVGDVLVANSSNRFQVDPEDVMGISDEMSIYKTHRYYANLNDGLELSDGIIQKYALFVTGGTGDGSYEHGERVPIVVTLVDDEQFLAWAGEEHFVEDIYAKSTYVHMPNETVRVEAIKGDISLSDILALGGRVSAARLDLVMEQGATFERNLYYKDTDGNPIDISGWTAEMQIREYKNSSTALLTLTSSAGNIIMAGPTGHLEIHIPANDMEALDFTWGYYDLELSPNGNATAAFRLLEGRVKLTKEVTR